MSDEAGRSGRSGDHQDLCRVQGGGQEISIFPSNGEDASRCEPIYEEMPGWKENTIGTKSMDALPANAQAYIKRIEELVGKPVDMVSTGPVREETLVLRHPFKG